MKVEDQLYWMYIPEGTNNRNQTFTWVGRQGPRAEGLVEMEHEKVVVLVRWGYYGFFKPSFAEVFSQIKDSLLERAVAFEIEGPETRDDMFGNPVIATILNEGYQLATITLYEKAK